MIFNSEHQLQAACVAWLRSSEYKFITPIFYSVPNGGFRSKKTAGIMYTEGQQAGIADLCIDLPSGTWHGLRIEMKIEKGKQSDNQLAYEAYCNINKFKYVVCRDFDDFKRIIIEWIDNADREAITSMKEYYRVLCIAQENKEKKKYAKKKASSIDDARKELSAVIGHQFCK